MPRRVGGVICKRAACLLALVACVGSVRLSFASEECIQHTDVREGDAITGSYVSMPNKRGRARFDLTVTQPDGAVLHSSKSLMEHEFKLTATSTGPHSFCLKDSASTGSKKWFAYKDVLWNLHVGHRPKHNKATDEHLGQMYKALDDISDRLRELTVFQEHSHDHSAAMNAEATQTQALLLPCVLLRSAVILVLTVGQIVVVRSVFNSNNKVVHGLLG